MRKNLPKFNNLNYVHLVTAKTYKNKRYFKNEKCCLILLEELNFYRKKMGFEVLGYVIMPDHLHCLIFWDVDRNPKLTISKIVQSFKSHSAKEILYYLQTGRRDSSLSPYSTSASEGSRLPDSLNEHDPKLGRREPLLVSSLYLDSQKPSFPAYYKWENTGEVHTKSKIKFWQKGFYDFNIYTEKKLKEKFDYIHITNPIKAGLCEKPEDYKWSSYCQIVGIEKHSVLRVNFL